MKLVFYGGGHDYENVRLDKALLELTEKSKPKITFIPSCSYLSEMDFHDFVNQYQKFNITRFINFPIDIPYDEVLKKEAFSSDIIHLSGGNTYYFLKYLRKKKIMKDLRNFVQKGGILTGLSAGGILMTRSIDTAGFPEFDKDENESKIKNFEGMNLVNFEFFPHYKNSNRYDKDLINHSKIARVPVYACPDGAGIIVNNEETKFIGKVYCFYRGKKHLIRS